MRKEKRTFADYLLKPIEVNSLFFVFMLLVGVIMNVSHRNPFGYLELLADVYVVSFLLSLCPKILRRGLQIILCSITYSIAFIDACCKTLFGTPITPTMLLLAQETTGRESEEFFSQYIKPELLFSTAGVILLIAFIIRKTKRSEKIKRSVPPRKTKRSFFRSPPIMQNASDFSGAFAVYSSLHFRHSSRTLHSHHHQAATSCAPSYSRICAHSRGSALCSSAAGLSAVP